MSPSPRILLLRMSHRSKVLATGLAALSLVVSGAVLGVTAAAQPQAQVQAQIQAQAQQTILGNSAPRTVTEHDANSVELGVQFSSSVGGTVTAIKFYKGPDNGGTHPVTLWSSGGLTLATGTSAPENESQTGWQTVEFSSPVSLMANQTYTASYHAGQGNYSVDDGGFDAPIHNGTLTVPISGGVYKYGNGSFPTDSYGNSNYYVDVVFAPDAGTSPTAGTSGPTSTPGVTTATPVPTNPGSDTTVNTLNLPRIPWEGGPAYWKQFSKADAAGWSDPGFFPITVWYNGISNNAEAQYDKSVGINTYIGMADTTPYSLFQDNNAFWIGDKLNSSFNDSSRNWVGDFLDDEVDGRFTPAEGRAHLQSLVDAAKGDGRFKYANFTQMVMSKDMNQTDAQAFVNNYTDAVSVDMYWYTIPYCSQTPYRNTYLAPVIQKNCRTASSYGKSVKSLRAQDAADGKLQAPWQFVEILNGGPGGGPFVANITPGQLQGAVMSSIINEARGLVYFNQSLSGPCQGGSIVRQSQVTPDFCGASQVAAAKEINNQVKQLAPVINTQSYRYSFGPALDTMLKTYSGSAYIFAMVDGNSSPGSRTFTLPADIKASSVEVVNENRTLAVDVHGTFTDNFPDEYSYHVYRIGS